MSTLKLADIVSSVSASINRGTKYDADIPIYVRKALTHLEREYSFGYMKRDGTVTVGAEVDPPVFTFPDTPIKSIRYVRYLADDSEYTYLQRSDKGQQTSKALPVSAYFTNNLTQGEIDAVLDEDLELEIGVYVFSSMLLDVDSPTTAEHDLFDYGEDVVANLTLMKMTHLDNAQDLFAAAKIMYDLEVKSLVNYALEKEESNRQRKPNYGKVLGHFR